MREPEGWVGRPLKLPWWPWKTALRGRRGSSQFGRPVVPKPRLLSDRFNRFGRCSQGR
jgi:hypothetical protein